jgi:hypothetical protein
MRYCFVYTSVPLKGFPELASVRQSQIEPALSVLADFSDGSRLHECSGLFINKPDNSKKEIHNETLDF